MDKKDGEQGGMLSAITVPEKYQVIALESILTQDGVTGWGHEFEFLTVRNSNMYIRNLEYDRETGLINARLDLQKN